MGKLRLAILMLLPLCALVCAQALMARVDGWMNAKFASRAGSVFGSAQAERLPELSDALTAAKGSIHRQLVLFRHEARSRSEGHDAVLHAEVAADGTVGAWSIDTASGRDDIDALLKTAIDTDDAADQDSASCHEKA